jgi:hypothetical protein
MNVCLSKKYTGLSRNLILNIEDCSISSSTGKEFWNSERVHHIMEFWSIEYQPIAIEYKRLISTLKVKCSSINWHNMLGKEIIENRTKMLIDSFVQNKPDDYVKYNFPKRIALFERLKGFVFRGESNDRLAYSHSSTVTGRTIISSGMNLMTMKKSDRAFLTSKYENGAIIEIDIKSLEPRLYLSLIKDINVEDAYTFLLTDILGYPNGSIDRDKIKLAFISLLYGASVNKIKSMTGLETKDIIKIKSYLSVSELINKITTEFEQNGYFKNAYGRKIYSINAPVNYYIQSTAADYACILYESLLEQLPRKGVDLIGVIHDAIILDCSKENIDEISSVTYCNEDIINIEAHLKVIRHS